MASIFLPRGAGLMEPSEDRKLDHQHGLGKTCRLMDFSLTACIVLCVAWN
jgi:hypothetical protein